MTQELDQRIHGGPVHFIGIGGISMSGIAQILLERGIPVTGSDQKEGVMTHRLRGMGAHITVPHDAACIGGQTLVVYTAAISMDNPELTAATEQGIPSMDRAAFLGLLAGGHTQVLTVSGTHGKTTSSGMLAHVLLASRVNPTIQIGGMLPAIGGNTRSGGTGWFLMEACEYKNSYHHFYPTHALILNIEADHLDFFRDLDDILASFSRFTSNLPDNGTLVLNLEDAGCCRLAAQLDRPITGYAVDAAAAPQADYTADNLRFEDGRGRFDVLLHGTRLAHITLDVPGRHNVQNALGCFALAHRAGLSVPHIAEGLAGFSGTGRRFEYKGSVNGAPVYDDYAHHPSEITATLAAARAMTSGHVFCVFQPHTYTRTKELFTDFAQVLATADQVCLVDIYAAREPDLGQVHARDLVRAIVERGGRAIYAETFDAAAGWLGAQATKGDLLLTLGAGDVGEVANRLLNT